MSSRVAAVIGGYIEAELTHDWKSLVITASGPAYSIVQLAEQLAWLTAALGHPTPEQGIGYKPFIAEEGDKTFKIGVEKGPLSPNIATNSHLEYALDLTHPIVYGYPTARRPEGFPGVEVSYRQLLRIATEGNDGGRPVENNRHIRLSGGRTFQLAKRRRGVCLWHLLKSELDAIAFARV